MYLSKTDIEKILRAFGLLDFFDDIFVSSEYKLLKSTGKLFMKVCGELRINKEEIIHIGDNVDSDALAPKRLGIDALWYYNKENLKRRDAVNRWKWGEKEADKYFNDIFKYSINDKTFEHYVRSCFAPDFCNFVYELLLFAYRNNIEIIYFIERDGNLFKNIAEKLVDGLSLFKYMNHIQFKLMKLPRRISSGLTDFSCAANIIHRAYDQNPPPEFSIDHVIGCFNLKYDDFDITEQEDIKKNDANILFFIENYERLFKEKIAKHNKRTGEYIESLGLYNYKKILLCDIGWGGRIQKDITRYLENIKSGIECWGVYYATYDKINEVKNYSYSNGIDLLHGWALLEFLIKEYTHGKDDMHKKILDNKLMEETYILNALSRSVILEYVPEYIRIMEENTLLPYDVKNFLHIRTENMIKNPPKEFCMQLERVHFNYNRKTNEESIPLIPIIKNEKDMERVRQTPQWVEGVEVLSGRCCLRRRNIFWLPRKIHSFFRCWRKNGLIYTIKYLIKKYLRKSGLMRIPRHGGDIHRSGTVEAMLRAARLK
jgi:predicted HAD superfamily hydrolase